MATGAQFRTLLASLTDISIGTLDRYLVALGNGRLVRRMRPGRGQLTGLEIVYILLGLAAPHPQLAAEAARMLSALMPDPPRESGASLGTMLAGSIDQLAWSLQQGTPPSQDFDDSQGELTLCLNPLRATMAWPSRGPEATRRYLPFIDAKTVAPATASPPAFRRDTVWVQPALLAVAKLHAGPPAVLVRPPHESTPAADLSGAA